MIFESFGGSVAADRVLKSLNKSVAANSDTSVEVVPTQLGQRIGIDIPRGNCRAFFLCPQRCKLQGGWGVDGFDNCWGNLGPGVAHDLGPSWVMQLARKGGGFPHMHRQRMVAFSFLGGALSMVLRCGCTYARVHACGHYLFGQLASRGYVHTCLWLYGTIYRDVAYSDIACLLCHVYASVIRSDTCLVLGCMSCSRPDACLAVWYMSSSRSNAHLVVGCLFSSRMHVELVHSRCPERFIAPRATSTAPDTLRGDLAHPLPPPPSPPWAPLAPMERRRYPMPWWCFAPLTQNAHARAQGRLAAWHYTPHT